MHRTPPAKVQIELRKEVAFGCPIRGCRSPFLTWHHFDPPWSKQPHHNASGMIALCRLHHDSADAGVYSLDELRELKAGSYSTSSVRAAFPWAKNELLIRLGGNYCGGSSAVVSTPEEDIIRLRAGPEGLQMLSFILRSEKGNVVARMADNGFQLYPPDPHNMVCNASATHIKIWLQQRDIGLDLRFGRLSKSELDERLTADKRRAEQNPVLKERLERFHRDMSHLPDSIRESIQDPTGFFVKQWAEEHCTDDEGKVTLLDFANISVNSGGRKIRIRSGIREGQRSYDYCAAFDNAGAFML